MIIESLLSNSKDIFFPQNIEIKNSLDSGAHGSVYQCNDEFGKVFAVKIMRNVHGFNHLLEASIMSQISHPNLNSALAIHGDSEFMFIFQEIAKSDLWEFIKANPKTSFEIKKEWIAKLLKAIRILHSNNIIHCDVKARNVLLYEDLNIKLTDFSSSVLKIDKKDCFLHRISTWTHMPIESVMKSSWNEKVDIWSLGCTLYEIVFECSLFPLQDEKENRLITQEDSVLESSPETIKQRYINSISSWGIKSREYRTFSELMDSDRIFCENILNEEIEFNSFTLHPEFLNSTYPEINKMILGCLYVSPKLRSNILELTPEEEYKVIEKLPRTIADSVISRVQNKLKEQTDKAQLIENALNIYRISNDDLDEKIKIEVCLLIAHKLSLKRKVVQTEIKDKIFEAERNLSNSLQFRFLKFKK